MILFRYILWVVLSSLSLLRVNGQVRNYVHYEVRDGLAGATVYSMAQDHDGFIWFATTAGLSRFDGTHFVNYTVQDGLPDNEITKLYVDSKNRVWFAPFKSTVGYILNGKVYTQGNDEILAKCRIRGNIFKIQEDIHGNMLFVEEYGLHLLDPAGRVTERFTSNSDSIRTVAGGGLNEHGNFRCLVTMNDSVMFADFVNGAFIYSRGIHTFAFTSCFGTIVDPHYEVCLDHDVFHFFDLADQSEFHIAHPKGWISVTPVNDSIVSMNGYSGVRLVNTHQKKIVDSFLLDQSVSGVMEDAEGNYWYSTMDNGVFRLSSKDLVTYPLWEKTKRLAVYSIRAFDSVVYMGGDHCELGIFDLRTGRIDQVRIRYNNLKGRILDITRIGRQGLMLGTDHGAYYVDLKTRKWKLQNFEMSIKTFQLYGDSMLVGSSNRSLFEIDLGHTKLSRTILDERTTCSYRDKGGTYYMGTLKGFATMKVGEKVVSWGERDSRLANRINAMVPGSNGIIWLATNGIGLVGFRDGKIVAHLTDRQGLTSNNCTAICISGETMWVGTDRGLNRVTDALGAPVVRNYTTANGLASDMINTVYAQGDDVFVGTPVGMDVFNERRLATQSACLLRMTGITVSDRHWRTDTSGFTLSHKDNNITFDFVGISFKSGGKVNYRYWLQGLDTAWKSTRQTFLNYPSLPSGDYELQLIAINEFGVASQQASIPFIVDKQLWERWWFRLAILAMVTSIVFYCFQYRLRLLKKKEAEKAGMNMKIAELEQMALRSQMNPHFIFNCLNSIQQYVIYRDVLGANEFITKFSYLIRQTLDLSTRQFISLSEEINYIDTYMALEKRRFDNKFIYDIVVSPEVDIMSCHIPPMILQPYIENAVRHGIGLRNDQNGQLKVMMSYRDGVLLCSIEDNGVGRKVARQYKSINSIAYQSVGMSLVAKRIEMINKTNRSMVQIDIEDLEGEKGNPLGTRIHIRFPLEIVLHS